MALNTADFIASTKFQVHPVNHRKLELVITIIGILLLLITYNIGRVSAAQPPIARIDSIGYPSHVFADSAFSVTVIVDYSSRVGVDVGVWDVRTGDVVQSVSIPLQNTGAVPFTLNLTSPAAPMDWQLLAVARIWWQDAWYQDPLEGSRQFTVNVSNITQTAVTLTSQAPALITLDGAQYQVTPLNSTNLTVTPGLHDLGAQPIIQNGEGERYVFAGWNDGVNSSSRIIAITADTTLSAEYRTEYYLTVASQLGQVSGEGWYPEGSNPEFVAVPPSSGSSWFGLGTANYQFAGWSGDSMSNETLASITMGGPRSVEANWVESGMTFDPMGVTYLLLIGSVILIVGGLWRNSRRHRSFTTFSQSRRHLRVLVPAALLLFALIPTSLAYAQLPVQSGPSIVKIGDASWYYWNNTASDTCLLWLGGGTTNEQAIGYYSYDINPFQYESFGTIRFMQDLAHHFCVIALESGSYASFSPDSNRTIHEEPYMMGSRIIIQVRDWLREQGYAHVFLVGYSSGAQVAAMEVAVSAPEQWTSPDGVILITPRLSQFVTGNAYRIHASLLVLYGGSIETPAYVSTGHDFYSNAPHDGWYDSHYQQKEFDVIEGTGHEVWTVFETGAYDTHAVRTIVNFVDEVRSFQLSSQEVSTILSYAQNPPETVNPISTLTLLTAPSEVSPSNLLRFQVRLTYNFLAATKSDIIVLDTATRRVANTATLILDGSGSRTVTFDFVPSSNSSQLSLSILALGRVTSGFQLIAKPLIANIRILQTINVTLLSTAPNAVIVFDGAEYRTATNGVLQLETRPGEHTLQASPLTNLSSNTRIIFAGWEDGSTGPTRRLNLESNTTLSANYRTQYFVNVTSGYGQATGSGWYDAGALAVVSVDRPLISEPKAIFAHWAGDVNSNEARTVFTITSANTATAEWMPVTVESNQPNATTWLLLSIVALLAGLAWNLNISRKGRASHNR